MDPDRARRRTGRGRGSSRWAVAWRVLMLAATVLAVEYLAVHLLPDVRESWDSVASAAPALLVVAVCAELASLCCYSALSSTILPVSRRLPYRTVLAIDVTGNGFSRVVPGGGASAAAMRFRLLTRAGMSAADAVEVTAMETAVADLWLVGALCAGLLLAVPGAGARPLVRAAATTAVVAVALFGGLVAVLMARPDQMITVTARIARRVPLLRAESLERLLRSVIARVQLVLASPEERRRIALWGLGNWLLDAACLYLCVAAMGRAPDVGGLLTTYALVELIAMLPITPGGLGVVEGVAVPLLVSFGVPDGRALLAVLAWRLFEYWLPIPLAVGAYLWLRTRGVVQPPSGRRSRGGGSGATAGGLARRLR